MKTCAERRRRIHVAEIGRFRRCWSTRKELGTATPSVAYTYADSGKAASATLSDGTSYAYGYDDRLLNTNESVTAGGESFSLNRTYDGFRRAHETAVVVTNVRHSAKARLYDSEDRVCGYALTNAAWRVFSVAYTNLAGYSHGYAITTPGGDEIRRVVSRGQYRRELATGVSTKFNGATLESYSYSYDALSRPTTRNSDVFGYNERGEVVFSRRGAEIAEDTYSYDGIGNLQIAAFNFVTNAYTHNSLNQISTATFPQLYTLNSQLSILHDLDGNLTNDCLFTYSYDAANRLSTVSSNGIVLVANEYDYRGRRTRKTTPTTETTFVYDNWNLVHETVSSINGNTTNTTEIQYFWGADLSNTLQGAGGIGGAACAFGQRRLLLPGLRQQRQHHEVHR